MEKNDSENTENIQKCDEKKWKWNPKSQQN